MFTVEDLKVIRLALSKYSWSKAVETALENVDAELAKHNLEARWVSKPKEKYKRQPEGEYQFFNIR